MNDPWQFLILDRNTATNRDVKAAYARLLKQHRPDKDPEGFKNLREAYEAALESIKQRDASSAVPPAYAVPDPASADDESATAAENLASFFDSSHLPEEAQAAYHVLEQAVGTNNDEQMQAATDAFSEACNCCRVASSDKVIALQKVFMQDVQIASRGVTCALIMDLAARGETNFCHVIVGTWEESGQHQQMVELANVMLSRRGLLTAPDAATLMARVALIIGLECPMTATELANSSFPHLPTDGRNELIARIEHQVAIGRPFAEVAPDMKSFWFRMLRTEPEARDWHSTEAQSALANAVERNRFQWEGWGIVQQMLPPEIWKSVEDELQKQIRKVQQSQRPHWSSKIGWVIVPVIILLSNFLRFLSPGSSSPSHPSRYDLPSNRDYPKTNEALRRLLETDQKPKVSGPSSTLIPAQSSTFNQMHFDRNTKVVPTSTPTLIVPSQAAGGSSSLFPGNSTIIMPPPNQRPADNSLIQLLKPNGIIPPPTTGIVPTIR